MTRRQWIGGIAAVLAIVAFGTSWTHCVDVLQFGGQPRELSWVIASLPEVTCLLVALRLMDGERGWLTWTVGAVGFGFTVAANASTAGGHVAEPTHWLWAYLGALWPAVSTVLAFLLMGHSAAEPTSIESTVIDVSPIRSTSIEGPDRGSIAPIGSGPAHSIEAAGRPDPIDPRSAPDPIRSTPVRSDRVAAAQARSTTPRSTARTPDRSTPDRIGSGTSRPARSVDDLVAALRAEIRGGQFPPDPSAEAIRVHFGIAPKTARAVRDAINPATAGGVQDEGKIN